MDRSAEILQVLLDLGLTRLTAEVYLAVLTAGGSGPLSAYAVARTMGRDPANLTKTLASLEKLGAVRAVQEKPRLYLAVPPREFSDRLVEEVQERRERAVALLESLVPEPQPRLVLGLRSPADLRERAERMLAEAATELVLLAGAGALASLAAGVAAAAARPGLSVVLVTAEPAGLAGVDERLLPAALAAQGLPGAAGLQLVCDRRSWLLGTLAEDPAPEAPCGWWCEDPLQAPILAAGLLAAAVGGPPPSVVEDTIQFLIRHDDDRAD